MRVSTCIGAGSSTACQLRSGKASRGRACFDVSRSNHGRLISAPLQREHAAARQLTGAQAAEQPLSPTSQLVTDSVVDQPPTVSRTTGFSPPQSAQPASIKVMKCNPPRLLLCSLFLHPTMTSLGLQYSWKVLASACRCLASAVVAQMPSTA